MPKIGKEYRAGRECGVRGVGIRLGRCNRVGRLFGRRLRVGRFGGSVGGFGVSDTVVDIERFDGFGNVLKVFKVFHDK